MPCRHCSSNLFFCVCIHVYVDLLFASLVIGFHGKLSQLSCQPWQSSSWKVELHLSPSFHHFKLHLWNVYRITIGEYYLFLCPFQLCFYLHMWICLNCRSVQTRAAAALGKLSALSTRVDPLVSDLLSMLQVAQMFCLFFCYMLEMMMMQVQK